MGLDAWICRKTREEVHYWRKEPGIHDWMEKHWRARGGEGEFNCKELLLDEELIQQFIDDLTADKLDFDRTGFFFGRASSPGDDDYEDFKEKTLKLFNRLLQETKDGATFVYDSWW